MRNLQFIFFLTLVTIFPSCAEQKTTVPIPEEKLIQVLADIHMAEAAMQGLHGSTKDSIAEEYYSQIEKIHEVDRALIDTTIILMRKDPTFIAATYSKVLEELSKREAELK